MMLQPARDMKYRGNSRPALGSQLSNRAVVSARYPEYAEYQTRLASFSRGSGWPLDKTQTPEEVAEAGLYFAGMSDCTRCFSCGGGLRNWLEGDIPLVEHSRFFPTCEYIKELRRNAPVSYSDGELQEDGHNATARAPVVDYEEIVQSVMLKPCGMALDVLGFSRSLIHDAITKVLSERDWDETQVTSQLLANACFDIEDDKKTAPSEGDPSPSTADRTIWNTNSANPPDAGNAGMDVVDGPPSPTADPIDFERLRISEENRKLKEAIKCKICLDKDVAVVYLPCGHLVTCTDCYSTQTRCPVCRAKIVANVRTYI